MIETEVQLSLAGGAEFVRFVRMDPDKPESVRDSLLPEPFLMTERDDWRARGRRPDSVFKERARESGWDGIFSRHRDEVLAAF